MSRILNDPVSRLVELVGGLRRRYIVGLSGVPGSGKTTISASWAEAVRKRVGDNRFVVLGMDGFHLRRSLLAAMPNPDEAFARRGAPWTFDPEAMATRLTDLRRGFGDRPVSWPGFDHGVGDPVENGDVVDPEVSLVMVEGIYTAISDGEWRNVSMQFDEQWYLDVPWSEASPRLIARHMAAWNMKAADASARAEDNDRINAELVASGREDADYLVYPELT